MKRIAKTLSLFFVAISAMTASAEPVMYFTNMNPGDKPVRSITGKYRALNRSMNGGGTSIRPEQVSSYGQPMVELWQGQVYWSVPVTYTLNGGRLGWHVAEARALVRDGNVVHWFYTAPKQGNIGFNTIKTPSSMNVR